MARVLGETGKYVTKQSVKQFQKSILILFVVFCLIAFVSGFQLAKNNIYLSLASISFFSFSLYLVNKMIKKFEKERLNFRKGAAGEAVVGFILESIPDDYNVLNDLKTDFGNIDHVVIGPTGVYVIDTKNWRGIVTADGNGELLLNGKPTQKPEVKNSVRTVMRIKEKINVLCNIDSYIQGVLAFPSAYVDAKWGTTGNVHCIRDEQLYDYIVENKNPNKLNKKEIELISKAFSQLARMDSGFEDKK